MFNNASNNLPVLNSLIKLAHVLTEKESLMMFIDLHGHSVKRNAFAYGPKYQINDVTFL